MTSQGAAHGRFSGALNQRNLFIAELSMRQMRPLSLFDARGHLDLLTEVKPEKLEQAAPALPRST